VRTAFFNSGYKPVASTRTRYKQALDSIQCGGFLVH